MKKHLLQLIFSALLLCSFGSLNSGAQDKRCTSQHDDQCTLEFDENFQQLSNEWPSYIVRFNNYRLQGKQHDLLRESLAGEGQKWQWVQRENLAVQFPTDFGLIKVGDQWLDKIKLLLQLIPEVKDLHLDKSVRHPKFWTHEQQQASPQATRTTPNSTRLWHEDHGPQHGHVQRDGKVTKKPGRLTTRPTYGLNGELDQLSESELRVKGRKLHSRLGKTQVTEVLQANKIWEKGFRGDDVRIGVFDTGIAVDHPHVQNIVERSNWTNEPTNDDKLGHGTFVAGVISSTSSDCKGMAPNVLLHTFRVFTNDQLSFTSWFMDAFNYAIATNMHVLNLSIGGPDYLDAPFVDKVLEITSNGILMVSAIGNDGPFYGTLNNPADQSDVIGVGGITYNDDIATFSSRGMSTWELPFGYGRAKPDVVAYGERVWGSKILSGCRALSGTSVASPVVAGAVALLASTVPKETRWQILNPASMKQALVEGAVPLPDDSMYTQGQGKINIINSYNILKTYERRASVVPATLDLTKTPFSWPFSAQPLYAHAQPVMFNATVLNALGVVGRFSKPPTYTATNAAGRALQLKFEYSDVLWPWSGYLTVYFVVDPAANITEPTLARVSVEFEIESPGVQGESGTRKSSVTWPIIAMVAPTPPRHQRILIDAMHNIRYPPSYVPRDNLEIRNDILDWHGDHIHTNYHGLYDALRLKGYYFEILTSPITCFDAKQYGTLLIIDSEDEFFPEEIAKLEEDVKQHGLGLIVFADWYNLPLMEHMRFYDDNTRSWWMPITGGSNVPALNDLLKPYDIQLGDSALQGRVRFANMDIHYAAGTHLARLPVGAYLWATKLQDSAKTEEVVRKRAGGMMGSEWPILGVANAGQGRVGVFGDSNCLDSSHMARPCYGLLLQLVEYVTRNSNTKVGFHEKTSIVTHMAVVEEDTTVDVELPQRGNLTNFEDYSVVVGKKCYCRMNSAFGFNGEQHADQWRRKEAPGGGTATGVAQEGMGDEGQSKEGAGVAGNQILGVDSQQRGGGQVSGQASTTGVPVTTGDQSGDPAEQQKDPQVSTGGDGSGEEAKPQQPVNDNASTQVQGTDQGTVLPTGTDAGVAEGGEHAQPIATNTGAMPGITPSTSGQGMQGHHPSMGWFSSVKGVRNIWGGGLPREANITAHLESAHDVAIRQQQLRRSQFFRDMFYAVMVAGTVLLVASWRYRSKKGSGDKGRSKHRSHGVARGGFFYKLLNAEWSKDQSRQV